MPCLGEFPHLSALAEKYKDQGLVVLGITADPEEQLDRVRSHVAKKDAKHVILWDRNVWDDDEDSASDAYDVSGIPATFIIDRKGGIVRWPGEEGDPIGENAHIGFARGDEKLLEKLVKTALAEK